MVDPSKGPEIAKASSVSRRFWALVVVVLVLAVVSAAMAARFSTIPFLRQLQQSAVGDQLHLDARNIENVLTKHEQYLTFIGTRSNVVNVALGEARDPNIIKNYLSTLPLPDTLKWVALYDRSGERIVAHGLQTDGDAVFSSARIRGQALLSANSIASASSRVSVGASEGHLHVLLAVPVRSGSVIQGVLMAEFALPKQDIFPPNEVAASTMLVSEEELSNLPVEKRAKALIQRLPEYGIAVVLLPDAEGLALTRTKLITNTVSAISLVLLVAFSVFAWLGRAVIIAPHIKLEEQTNKLTELAALAQMSANAITVTDLQSRVIWANPAFEKLSGYSSDEIIGQRPGVVLQSEVTDTATVKQLAKAIRSQQPIEVEIENTSKTGKHYWIRLSIAPLHNQDGSCYGFMSIQHDITEMRHQRAAIIAAKREIEEQALHDPLTGLPNRRTLDIALAERARRPGDDATIVRIDLDHFKHVNDTLGHAAGDFVLCEVSDILREETKRGDLPVRVGGDEFVLLLEKGNTSKQGMALAQRMLNRIRQPMDFEGKTVRVGASFGVACTLDGLLPMDQLIIGADAALYEAKEQGRNAVRLYAPELHRKVLDRRDLAREVRKGILNEEFEPYFQPQFDAKTLDIVGVETLVRWHSPVLGRIMPGTFLPVVEQLSALNDVDDIVFKKAIAYAEELREDGIEIPKLSFNVSASRIQNADMANIVRRVSQNGPKIGFEILESVLVEEQTELFTFGLDRLRELDVSIEVDDFGSGHASVIGLMHLRPDVMKVDQRLVMPIVHCEMTRGLLRQIIGMSKLMGLKVTAEGVETMEHARILQELGCHTFQGYAFAHPLSVGEFREFALSYRPNIASVTGTAVRHLMTATR
ncbi:GGDEF and EAL domain-containing protein [Aliishimia ponticola]|uniref:GGDEF and EAL domain-containing protein n=1 Tax=Aliishimia ponticola TaxID=2499833 RepID=A0A4S4NDX2_9RHOB|nr:EAL domain-containing protein [Aliishimia ponticola]THH36945.1 GGDEF and EAL domain-containing protein [Aliishimia ponticola]